MDRLDSMRVFCRVAELGSFSAAARQLGVARSVVTRQVAALEAHLGVKLIARSTRRLNLTSAGVDYLEKCRQIVSLVDAAESGIAEQRQVPRGNVRISVPLSFGLRHLTALLLDFSAAHPEVTLDVDYTDRRINLIEDGADLAIRITGRLAPQDVARRISVCRGVVVASPAYLAAHGEPTHPSQLVDHQCFGYTAGDRNAWSFLIDGRLESFAIRPRLCANNGDALLDAAERGMGITNPPTFIAASAIEAGLVRPILGAFPQPELGIHAVFPGTRHVPQRVRLLVDFLIERIGPEPYWDTVALFGGRRRSGAVAGKSAIP